MNVSINTPLTVEQKKAVISGLVNEATEWYAKNEKNFRKGFFADAKKASELISQDEVLACNTYAANWAVWSDVFAPILGYAVCDQIKTGEDLAKCLPDNMRSIDGELCTFVSEVLKKGTPKTADLYNKDGVLVQKGSAAVPPVKMISKKTLKEAKKSLTNWRVFAEVLWYGYICGGNVVSTRAKESAEKYIKSIESTKKLQDLMNDAVEDSKFVKKYLSSSKESVKSKAV